MEKSGSRQSMFQCEGMTRVPSLIRNTDAPVAPAIIPLSRCRIPSVILSATPDTTTP